MEKLNLQKAEVWQCGNQKVEASKAMLTKHVYVHEYPGKYMDTSLIILISCFFFKCSWNFHIRQTRKQKNAVLFY